MDTRLRASRAPVSARSRPPRAGKSSAVTSLPEAMQPATCTATTKLGRRCRKVAVERGLCVFHSGRAGDPAELGRRGGLARGRKQTPDQRFARLAERAYAALEELLDGGAAKVRAATELLDRLRAARPARRRHGPPSCRVGSVGACGCRCSCPCPPRPRDEDGGQRAASPADRASARCPRPPPSAA
jgi:hypothetical protein